MNAVPSPEEATSKPRRRFLTWLLLSLSLVVPAVATLAIHALRKHVEQAHHAQIALARILADASELETMEYEAIANEKLDAGLSEQIERERTEVSVAVNELIRLHPADPQLQKIAKDFQTYTRNTREEFRLLTAGDVAAAKVCDEEKVDPSFDVLHKSIRDANLTFGLAADRLVRVVDVGSAAMTLFACVVMGLLFWRLRAAELAAIEQESLRAANESLRNEVTERKRAEEALRELQRQQCALLDNIPDIAWVKDKENRYVAVNEALSKAYGRKTEEIVGKTDFEMVPRELAERYRADDKRVMESRQRERIQEPFEDAAGNRTWIDTIKSPIINDKGEVIGTAGIARDFTARKNMEEALRASEERYRSLFETMREGLALCEIICDDAGKPCDFRYLEVNSAFEEIIGIKRGDALNKTARELFPQIEGYWIDTYGKVALTGEAAHFENYLQAMDKHFAVAAFSPKPGQFAAIFVDITERKRTDETLQETNRRLEHALAELKAAEQQVIQQERLRALGTMASGIAHDFNNALTVILGFSDVLLQHSEYLNDKEKTRNFLQLLNTAAKDAGNVVNRLREFYRHREEGEAFVPVELDELVQQAISLTQPKWRAQAETRGVSIDVRTELQPIPPVAGNAAELREALTNLILNAVDAMPRGGTITIRTRHDGGHNVLEVADTGTGMTEEVRRRCLEPFFTTKGERGTGLGLSMVYGIVQRHEGTIDIQSEIGKGTTFIICLPHRAAKPQEPEDNEPTPDILQPLRVLVVDDETVVRNVIGEYLKADGHTVEAATDGHDGLERFRAGRFDLVLLDRAMPGLNGDQVAIAMKFVNPNIPIVMLTGFGSMMEAAGDHPADVDLVVGKPVTVKTLRAALTKAVASAN